MAFFETFNRFRRSARRLFSHRAVENRSATDFSPHYAVDELRHYAVVNRSGKTFFPATLLASFIFDFSICVICDL